MVIIIDIKGKCVYALPFFFSIFQRGFLKVLKEILGGKIKFASKMLLSSIVPPVI